MSFDVLPKQLLIEFVKRVTILVNLIPRKGGVLAAMSSREIITGKKLQVPKYKIREYIQGHIQTTNNAGEERSLYLEPANNGFGHTIFELQKKQKSSVPRVTLILMTNEIINRVNKLGKE